MVKFILVTFGFLGLVFYELSGGNTFGAEALRLSRMDPVAPSDAPLVRVASLDVSDATLATPAPQITPDAVAETATVTRASFDLNAIQAPIEPNITQATLTFAVLTEPEIKQTLILPSLIARPETGAVAITEDDT